MHELGIAEDMLQVALSQAAKNNAKRITAFNIEMSSLADESEESLRFYFENLAHGTIAEGARVDIVRVSDRVKCLDCMREFTPDSTTTCPHCGGVRWRPMVHDEFRLVSIDVE